MGELKRTWDLISNDKRKISIEEIMTFFAKERDEEIGVIAAEEILDFFLQEVAMEIYNKGVEDSRDILRSRFGDLDMDLELLFKK
ncbi:MAG: DUF2164 domain-containing protein [Candidatus Magasanikbacteria bacterium CG_4_9_14_3_um_filter_32_9]|uniref:DUF2164 domain-containing protein n=1 Tax=Candidatus Magasanikbacteria bacterium CG_4_9_14_3_um_filter_32_9 TaxID=1974644 RepID=A0A2M7Z613_9BACT|nr:MAG: DUF2164 domain-containing protein [Candidatus Magasanikbacteria bacterium CG_4_9_14_3_um_filter_32_9]